MSAPRGGLSPGGGQHHVRCTTCGTDLRGGATAVDGKPYCDVHARQREGNMFGSRAPIDPGTFTKSPGPLPNHRPKEPEHIPFYTPDILKPGPVSPMSLSPGGGRGLRGASPISPRDRGVPAKFNAYGASVNSAVSSEYSSQRMTSSSQGFGGSSYAPVSAPPPVSAPVAAPPPSAPLGELGRSDTLELSEASTESGRPPSPIELIEETRRALAIPPSEECTQAVENRLITAKDYLRALRERLESGDPRERNESGQSSSQSERPSGLSRSDSYQWPPPPRPVTRTSIYWKVPPDHFSATNPDGKLRGPESEDYLNLVRYKRKLDAQGRPLPLRDELRKCGSIGRAQNLEGVIYREDPAKKHRVNQYGLYYSPSKHRRRTAPIILERPYRSSPDGQPTETITLTQTSSHQNTQVAVTSSLTQEYASASCTLDATQDSLSVNQPLTKVKSLKDVPSVADPNFPSLDTKSPGFESDWTTVEPRFVEKSQSGELLEEKKRGRKKTTDGRHSVSMDGGEEPPRAWLKSELSVSDMEQEVPEVLIPVSETNYVTALASDLIEEVVLSAEKSVMQEDEDRQLTVAYEVAESSGIRTKVISSHESAVPPPKPRPPPSAFSEAHLRPDTQSSLERRSLSSPTTTIILRSEESFDRETQSGHRDSLRYQATSAAGYAETGPPLGAFDPFKFDPAALRPASQEDLSALDSARQLIRAELDCAQEMEGSGKAPAGGNVGSEARTPRRGKGVLKQLGELPRIPVCESCHREIRGPFVLAMGKTWDPDCFACNNAQCGRKLMDVGFVEEGGRIYCEFCFEQYLAPACAQCGRAVVGDCLNAIDRQWHPDCFACTACRKPFGNNTFFLEDGKPYCEDDWNGMFTTKCVSCQFPIEAGDRWVEALDHAYHSNCFTCSVSHFNPRVVVFKLQMCHKNLEGQSFYAKGGRPYCKAHA